jgi:hypothetical protein
MTGETPGKPVLRVVRGNPTPEELAALVTVLSVATAAGQRPPPAERSRWADPAARLRRPLQPGPDAWSRSGLPY